MATKEEIVIYLNNLIVSLEKIGHAYVRGSNVVIKLNGQFTKTQLDHLINQYAEITDFLIEDLYAYFEIVYFYTEV